MIKECKGVYYDDINNFEYQCFDEDGTLLEHFAQSFEFSLHQECNQTLFSDFKQDLLDSSIKWFIPEELTDDTMVNYCDYY